MEYINSPSNIDCTLFLKASELLNTTKNQDYGKPKDNFTRIAKYWTTYLSNKFHQDIVVLPSDVAALMILFKIARLQNGYKYDSMVDIAGYTAIYDKLYQEEL